MKRLICAVLVLTCLLAARAQPPRPPEPYTVTPADGSQVAEPRPVISVDFKQGEFDPSTARLWVDRQEVTLMSLKNPSFVSYRPDTDLTGPVEVRFWARNRDGLGVEKRWKFEVTVSGRITAIDHNAREKLGEYDDLVVELKGKSGGHAWFNLEDFKENLPMDEVAPGLYRGTYVVQPGDYRLQARVVGFLKFGSQVDSRACDRPVKLFANVFQVRILSPPSGSQVDGHVELKGRTRPNARIVAVIRVSFSENMPPPKSDTDEHDGLERGQADEKGYFTLDYGPPVVLPNWCVVISVFAVDAEGNRSVPAIVRYRL